MQHPDESDVFFGIFFHQVTADRNTLSRVGSQLRSDGQSNAPYTKLQGTEDLDRVSVSCCCRARRGERSESNVARLPDLRPYSLSSVALAKEEASKRAAARRERSKFDGRSRDSHAGKPSVLGVMEFFSNLFRDGTRPAKDSSPWETARWTFRWPKARATPFLDHFGDQIGSMAESDFSKGEASLRRDAGIVMKRERSGWENPARISPPPRSTFLPTLKNSMLPI